MEILSKWKKEFEEYAEKQPLEWRERAVRNISLFLIIELISIKYTKAVCVISAQEQYLKLKLGREN